MSAVRQGSRPVLQCARCIKQDASPLSTHTRALSSTSRRPQEQEAATVQSTPTIDPNTVFTPKAERRLLREQRVVPVGSRRRRAALAASGQGRIPFEQLPYQCFQEARKILTGDREEKINQINVQRGRIERLKAQQVSPQDERQKEHRISSMQRHLEELKIHADINDPLVKKRFEDGQGDMNKPIYRFLADRKWREYKRKLLEQRITQMNVVPDVLPSVDLVTDIDIAFGSRAVQPGEFVDSRVSEIPARLNLQVFDKGERYVTIAVVNPDVPNVEKDGFDYRCHFLASNIKISPTQGRVPLHQLSPDDQIVLPWLPAYTQKGAPYSRMSIFILQQQEGHMIDVKPLQGKTERHGFKLRSFVDRHLLKPVGASLFRSQYDEGTAGVMQRAGVPGHDVEFKRKKIEPLPYKKLPGSRYR